MSFNPVLLPVLCMVFLTFVVWVYLFALRLPEISRKKIDPQNLILFKTAADAEENGFKPSSFARERISKPDKERSLQ